MGVSFLLRSASAARSLISVELELKRSTSFWVFSCILTVCILDSNLHSVIGRWNICWPISTIVHSFFSLALPKSGPVRFATDALTTHLP